MFVATPAGRHERVPGLIRRAVVGAATLAVAALLPSPVVAQAAATPSTKTLIRQPAQVSVPSSSGSLSLQAALERALASNAEILAARVRIEAAGARPAQAGSLPDPMITGVFRNVSFDDITIGEEMSQLDLISRRVVREIASEFFELHYLQEAIAVVGDTRGYLVNLEQTAQARYAVGEGIQQDVLKAQVEISVLLNRLIVLDQQHDSVETRLNRMLDQPVGTSLGIPESMQPPTWDFDFEELVADAMGSSALVRERARQVEQQQAGLELARRDTKPDWVVGGGWLYRGELPDIWEVNVGLTLPIYKGGKQDRAIEEATAEVRASQFDHRDSTSVVAAAVREHYLHADRAEKLVRLYREAIIPQATLSLESAIAGYEVGRVDFLTVLDNVVTLLTYRLEYSRQNTDYMQALVAIEEHLGRSVGVTPAAIMQRLPAPNSGGGPTPTIAGGER